VGVREVGEVEVDHTIACCCVDSSIDMVVAIVVSNSGVFDTLDGVGGV